MACNVGGPAYPSTIQEVQTVNREPSLDSWNSLRTEFARRSSQHPNNSPITAKLPIRAVIWDKTGGRCWYCGCFLHPFRTFQIDHVVPVTAGGATTFDNLVPVCRTCNRRKRDLSLEDFRAFCQKPSVAFQFSPEQIAYLAENGLDFSSIPTPPFRFYFEEQGFSERVSE